MPDLFSGFSGTSKEQWKGQVLKELKGESYDSLIWHTSNGFPIEPYYTSEESGVYEPAFGHCTWKICVNAMAGDDASKNKRLLDGLSFGADSIAVRLNAHDHIEKVLENIALDSIQSLIWCEAKTQNSLQAYLQKRYKTLNDCYVFAVSDNAGDPGASGVTALTADVLPFHNKGCNGYYEVALALALFSELMHRQSDPRSVQSFTLRLGVAGDYLSEIAKLRALRRLFLLLKKEFECDIVLQVVAETSLTNKAFSDTHNNLIRTSAEIMSAVLGGANTVIVNPFDHFRSAKDPDALRMAICQQLVVREETFLSQMADVSCGSYFIERMTDNIASRALETFKRIEEAGGFDHYMATGLVNSDIAAQSAEKDADMRSGKTVSIGVTRYRNEKESERYAAADLAHSAAEGISNPSLTFELENFRTNGHA